MPVEKTYRVPQGIEAMAIEFAALLNAQMVAFVELAPKRGYCVLTPRGTVGDILFCIEVKPETGLTISPITSAMEPGQVGHDLLLLVKRAAVH